MKTILSNWSISRILRLIIGLIVFVYGITIIDWALIIVGGMFGFMAMANSACGPFSNSCEVDQSPKQKKND